MAQLKPQALGSLFVASYDSQGYGGVIPPRLNTGLKTQFLLDPVRTSQETHYVTATKPNRLMLFRKTVAVYCKNHTEQTDTLCCQNPKFCCVKAGGTYSNHCALQS
jgi:hypothetical protein